MFFWRKRNQGFEWREYVRTEILHRRRARRQKLDDAKAAAVFGVKQAGRAGASAAASSASAAAHGTVTFLAWLGPVLKRLLLEAAVRLRVAARHSGTALAWALKKAGAGFSSLLAALGVALAAMLRGAAAVLGPALAWSGAHIVRLLRARPRVSPPADHPASPCADGGRSRHLCGLRRLDQRPR